MSLYSTSRSASGRFVSGCTTAERARTQGVLRHGLVGHEHDPVANALCRPPVSRKLHELDHEMAADEIGLACILEGREADRRSSALVRLGEIKMYEQAFEPAIAQLPLRAVTVSRRNASRATLPCGVSTKMKSTGCGLYLAIVSGVGSADLVDRNAQHDGETARRVVFHIQTLRPSTGKRETSTP
jgi:hypothetical protein